MHHIAKLGVESVFPSVGVALEELTEGVPDVGSGGAVVIEHVEDLGGDAGVEPLDDREIVFQPLRIVGAGKTVGGDMRAQVAAAEVEIEEMSPMVVVVGGEIKNYGDVGADVGDCVSKRYWCGEDGCRVVLWSYGEGRERSGRGVGSLGDECGPALEVAGRRRRWRWRSHTLNPGTGI